MNGFFAHGDYYVPLATTEAALVASYSRGAQLLTEAGDCSAALLNDGVSRAPGFAFVGLAECGRSVLWITTNPTRLNEVAESTRRHGKLADVRATVEGNHVYLAFEFTNGDASGHKHGDGGHGRGMPIYQGEPVRPQSDRPDHHRSAFVITAGKPAVEKA